ncbi:MAG: hypothetical protein V5A66_02420 [Candidatus Thermoplasmatota archaeon]
MGIWDLFKGYAFFKLVGLGISFTFIGIVITGVIIFQHEYSLLICNIPTFLIGGGALFIARKIWKDEKESGRSSSSSVKVGYSKEADLKVCPECGVKKMEVETDDSGFCKNCGHATREYYEEAESEA